jgi:hypothetical protein
MQSICNQTIETDIIQAKNIYILGKIDEKLKVPLQYKMHTNIAKIRFYAPITGALGKGRI